MLLRIVAHHHVYPNHVFAGLGLPVLGEVAVHQHDGIVALPSRLLIDGHVEVAVLEIVFHGFRHVVADQNRVRLRGKLLIGILAAGIGARGAVGEDAVQVGIGAHDVADHLERLVLVVAVFVFAHDFDARVALQGVLEAVPAIHRRAGMKEAGHDRDPSLTAQQPAHHFTGELAREEGILSDEDQALAVLCVGIEGHHRHAALDEAVDVGSERVAARIQHDAVVFAVIQRLQNLLLILHAQRFTQNLVHRHAVIEGLLDRILKAVADVLIEEKRLAGRDCGNAKLALTSQRACDLVRMIAQPLRGLQHPAAGCLADARAVVQRPVDGSDRDVRFLRNRLNCHSAHPYLPSRPVLPYIITDSTQEFHTKIAPPMHEKATEQAPGTHSGGPEYVSFLSRRRRCPTAASPRPAGPASAGCAP